MTSDKNKEQFEKWYKSNVEDFNNGGCFFPVFEIFDTYPFEMQIGVYLAYYDSLDLIVDAHSNGYYNVRFRFEPKQRINGYIKQTRENYHLLKRNEAYKEAFKKANDLINKE